MVEKILNPDRISLSVSNDLYKAFYRDAGKDVADFIAEIAPLKNQKKVLYYPEKGQYNKEVDYSNIRTIIDLRSLNKVKDINKHLISINKLLPDAGLFFGKFESYYNRKTRLLNRWGKNLGRIIWILDSIINRILPKLPLTKNIYNLFTGGNYKVISLAETLGRSVYCGFEIIDFKNFDNITYISVIKTSEPKREGDPSFGPLFKMRRIGKDGKMFGVYKLRTMHPYSEYLQNFIINLNGYNEYGKVKNDFRVTDWSKIVRKLYLDELPQLLNVLKGEMNLIGVRPLSMVGYNLLPEDLQKERIKYKPGCIPPYVALRKKGLEGVLEAERIYLHEMEKNVLKTKLKYFFKAIFNILSLKVTSN